MRRLSLGVCTLLAACSDSASPTDGTGANASSGQTGSANGPGATSSSSGTGGAGGDFSKVNPIEGAPAVELVQGGFGFTEGPCWFASLGVLRFSDQAAGIYELSGDVIAPWSPGSPNGNAIAPNGDMITCYPAARDVERSPADSPSFALITASYMGLTFNAPNDVIVRSDGNIYFTDPDYGLPAQDHELGFNGVYRVAPGAGGNSLITSALTMPNGIALSPDETHLYVADEASAQLYRFDVHPDGAVDNGMLFISTSPHPDGMAVDDAGNLYLATESGIDVRKPDGTPWGILQVDEQPANCTFGGADRRMLFITARTGLYRVHLNVPGKP